MSVGSDSCYGYTPSRSDALVVGGQLLEVDGLSVRNWADEAVHHFEPNRLDCRDADQIDEIVVHESESTEWTDSQVDALQGHEPPLGVHFAVLRDGTVYQHNDVVQRLPHAAPHNDRSIAIEVVNDPVPGDGSAPRLDSTVWNTLGSDDDRPYRTPTEAQMQATSRLVSQFTRGGSGSPVRVPLTWPGVLNEYFVCYNVPSLNGDGADPVTGITAHGHFGGPEAHIDGYFPTLYLWLRLSADGGAGFDHDDAWERARRIATDGEYLPAGAIPSYDLEGRPAVSVADVA